MPNEYHLEKDLTCDDFLRDSELMTIEIKCNKCNKINVFDEKELLLKWSKQKSVLRKAGLA